MDTAYVLRIVITMLICFVVVLVMQKASFAQGMSRVKRALLTGATVFAALMVLEIAWPRA